MARQKQRVSLFGDGITRLGDVVTRLTREDEDEIAYADYSEYGMHAAYLLRRQGWRMEKVRWEPPTEEVRAYGTGIWDVGTAWVGGNFCGKREYDGKPVIR